MLQFPVSMVWSLLTLGGICETKLPVCNGNRDFTSFCAFLIHFPQHQTSLTTSTSSQSTYLPTQPQPRQQQTAEMKQPPMKPAPKRDAVDKPAPKPKPWYARPSWVSKPSPKPKPFKPTARPTPASPRRSTGPSGRWKGAWLPTRFRLRGHSSRSGWH
jgi:hypothetical protein